MDPFSIAGGVASFIGLVGQAAQGVQFLMQVIDDFQDAPKMILDLRSQLDLLNRVLEDIRTICEKDHDIPVSKGITDGTRICGEHIQSLTEFIEKHDFLRNRGGPKRAWRQFLVSSKKAKFQRHIEDIQSAQSSLSLALIAHNLAKEGFHGDLLKFVIPGNLKSETLTNTKRLENSKQVRI
jgi:hypothetical protein